MRYTDRTNRSGRSDWRGDVFEAPPAQTDESPPSEFMRQMNAAIMRLSAEIQDMRIQHEPRAAAASATPRVRRGVSFEGMAFDHRGSRRFTQEEPEYRGSTKAKLSTPPAFEGKYTEEYNILNWIVTVERYLYNCDISREMYSSYAYTYMAKVVQAWFDTRFLANPQPDWETAVAALKTRYLPMDHVPRLLRKFANFKQFRSLGD